jgi:glycine/D-amino acid oxidase-like deaminating enzyme
METLGNEIAIDIYRAGVEAICSVGALVARLGIDCGFRTKNSIYIANSAKDVAWLKREFHARQGGGLDVHWLTSSELSSRYHANGLGAIQSAAGASLDAYRLAHGLLAYSRLHYDLQVYDHTALAGIEYDGQHAKGNTDNGHMINAQWVIYATGYETQSFIRDKIVDLLSTYVCISEPMQDIPAHLENSIYWTTDSPYTYIRSTSDKRILVGGEDEPFINPEQRDKVIDKKETALLARLKALMPDLEITPDFSWAGTFGVTRDSLPYMGAHPDFPRSLFVLGYGGNGITFSALAMKVISDAICGRKNRFLDYFRFNRY